MQTTPVKSKAAPLAMSSLRLLGWLLLLLPTFALAAALPTVSRVKDINITFNGGGSDPQHITRVGNLTFFTAYTPTTGYELWKSDGTAAGTVLVKDIYPGTGSAWYIDMGMVYDPNFTAVGNVLYFRADNGVNGYELWRSNGTAEGTVIVKDINAGGGNSLDYYSNLTAVGSMLYFNADNGVNGDELWKSDGTAAGTVLVKDINTGSGSAWNYDGNHNLTAVGTVLYFCADNGVNGRELWRSDGTAAGTVLVKDIYIGTSHSSPNNLTAVGTVLYFRADNGVNGRELWRSDGTAAGTVLVKDIYIGTSHSSPNNLTAVGNVLYFGADNGVNGYELWKSDGTAAGTVLVKDIIAGSDSALDYYSDLTAVGNLLYFTAYNGVNGYELWCSDGTAAGTVIVKDIYAGIGDSLGYYSNFTAIGTTLYFVADDGAHNPELWKSDGTVIGTVLVKDINPVNSYPYPSYLTAVGNTLYFNADNGVNGRELWKSDGTAAGTVLVKDIYAGSRSSYPYYLTAAGNVLYFLANNGVTGDELWKTDGTAAGTVLVKDINAGSGSAFCDDHGCYGTNFTAVGMVLYFSANDGINGWELWRSDGTAAGTVLVKDINAGSGNSSPDYLTAVGNVLYFRADNGVNGDELWRSDGTAVGTLMVKDINAGNKDSLNWNAYLTTVGTTLYFIADDGMHGSELWKSNGTAAGTILVKDISVGSGSAFTWDDPNFTVIGTTLYFVAGGATLWKSDATTAGAMLVKNIRTIGTSRSSCYNNICYINGLTAVGTTLYFVADDGLHGWELWKSNGTAAGTVLVKDINTGTTNSLCSYSEILNTYYCSDLIAVGNVLYFVANDGMHGWELWKSDNTAGAVLVKDINSGAGDSLDYYDSDLIAVGNMLYFTANNGVNGVELWKSNGTTAGTIMVKDIWLGLGSAWGDYDDPNFTAVGNLLYFRANNGINGDELWQTDGSTAGTQMKELVPGSGGSDPDYLTAIGTKLYFSALDNATGRELWRADIPNLLTVTPSANTGGFITSTVPQAVALNGTAKFTVTPLPNYARNLTVGGTCPQGSWSAGSTSSPSVWTTGAITANCTVVFGFISTLPDFVVTAITLPTTPIVNNGTFTATITVKNQGPVAGDGKNLDVWHHQPAAQVCGVTGTKRVAVGTLTAGQSKLFAVSLPSGIAAAKTLRAFIDSGCGTAESNEGNNQLTKAYTVQ